MNKKIYIFFFVLLGFILNIFIYIFSDNYRYFLQSLKSDSGYEVNDKLKVDLNSIVSKPEEQKKEDNIFSGLQRDFFEEERENNKNIKKKTEYKENKREEIRETKKTDKKVKFLSKREDIKITNIEKDILKSFKKYNLKEVELHPRLFDLTNEYPDKYFEYYAKDITLYFFGNKSFEDLKDIFEVLSYELPFTIKQVDNFGQKSFYINLNPLFDDGFVRIVIQKSNRTFGIKIKKDLYNKIKNNLGVIFKK